MRVNSPEGLTTPKHEKDRWRLAAASIIDGCRSKGRHIPAGVLLPFEHGRLMEVYLGAPSPEGHQPVDPGELLIEITHDFMEAARRGMHISGSTKNDLLPDD